MGLKVIIAEKPSLAKNIVAAIDKNMKMTNGYYANDEYIVTFAFGHLFSLYDVEQYLPDYNPDTKYSWQLNGLPFYPESFKFGLKRDSGVIKQFKVIRDLINRDDVDTIINAGDSDREGEIIVRLIIKYALKNNKSIKRLWMPDQTPKTIKAELETMREDSDYDNLANEGLARTYVDWLYGINLTRYATIKSTTLLRVGRVIAPIVQAIYERDMAIANFVPQKYFQISSKEKTNGEDVELTSKKEFPKEKEEDAKQFCDNYNSLEAKVTSLNSEKKFISPGKLYSLSKLQGELGKKYKMSLEKSLQIVQNLYEKGYVSYPRTPSQYLAENEKPKFREIIKNFQNVGVAVEFKDTKWIFDDSKIESHSALTPTYKIPKKSDLSEEEYFVYKTIANRFFAVFSKEACEVSRTTMEITLGNNIETFKLVGDVVLNKGWTVFEEREKKDKILPNLQLGDKVNINFKPIEKETNPPKHYTVETLNNFLKNPFKDNLKEIEEDIELEEDKTEAEELKAMFEGVELGTEATRSGIIANAVNSQYISLKDNTYKLEPKGKYYVETLSALRIMMSKEKTAELGKSLKKVYKGEYVINQAVEIAKKEINEVFEENVNLVNNYVPKIFDVDKEHQLCKCPKCKNIIAITDKGYRCNNSVCGLSLYTNNKLFETLNKKITKTIAKQIFTKGEVTFEDLVSKNGTTYTATLVADFQDRFVKFKFQFPDQKINDDSNGKA